MLTSMTNTTRYAFIAAVLIILAVAAYTVRTNSTRSGTESQSAEQVVDLEVSAQKAYEANGGKYQD